jgi:hypothetical protein
VVHEASDYISQINSSTYTDDERINNLTWTWLKGIIGILDNVEVPWQKLIDDSTAQGNEFTHMAIKILSRN